LEERARAEAEKKGEPPETAKPEKKDQYNFINVGAPARQVWPLLGPCGSHPDEKMKKLTTGGYSRL
jgi:hypothetical protein